MFRWDFARSAEAIFSRWAVKRVCKFLLKKKLGDIILGDIDLDQLEVQISRGTIQLSDLALNVDYINQKLVGAAVVLKEGSIASLSIKIPWKLRNCQIEINELELVLAPFIGNKIQLTDNFPSSTDDDKYLSRLGSDKIEMGTELGNRGSAFVDIHEGVKTIAKVVKWFLTSFYVRLNNLIVAFDPCLDMDKNVLPLNRSLVLRITEIEFGTCPSEEIDKLSILKSGCLLGMAKLTNFMKFEGAVVEVLMMNESEKMNLFDKGSYSHGCLESSYIADRPSILPSGSTTAILSGRNAGFSGRIDLSIPWKNGNLDIHKVDADVSFNQIELRLWPSTIEWIIIVWESLKSAGKAARCYLSSNTIDYSCSASRFHNLPPTKNSGVERVDITQKNRKVSEDTYFGTDEEAFPTDLFPGTHVIHNWVPFSFKEEHNEVEQDYGASIDQFFECFDGLRSCHANSQSSGLWNWTCSVFSAINVASNLASGSSHILTEHQHVETLLRATISGISVFLYFHDKEENLSDQFVGDDRECKSSVLDCCSGLSSQVVSSLTSGQNLESYTSCFSLMNVYQSTWPEPNHSGLKLHHLEAKCCDTEVNFQIGSRKMDCHILVRHAKVDECYDYKSQEKRFKLSGNGNKSGQVLVNKHLKQKIQASLSPFPIFVDDHNQDASLELDMDNACDNSSSEEQLIKVGILESFGHCNFHSVVTLADSNGCSISSTSFSVHFPPCILWFHFHLADSLLSFFKEVEGYYDKSHEAIDHVYDSLSGGRKLDSPCNMKNGASSLQTIRRKDNLHGNIVFCQTRIIICFPSQGQIDFKHSYPLDNFIILEHSPFVMMEEVSDVSPLSSKHFGAPNGNSCPNFSIHFVVGNINIYMINSKSFDSSMDQSVHEDMSAVKILSLTNRLGDPSGINVLCQKGLVTGSWMASRAWSLASTHDQRSRNKVTGKGCEFSSVSAAEDSGEISSEIRQELTLSSTFLLHLCFSIVRLNINRHEYELLNHLLDYVLDGLSNGVCSKVSLCDEQSLNDDVASQATIIMDFDLLDVSITLEDAQECVLSVQKELEGSWICFRMTVEKLEMMTVSNIGCISGTNFFWLNHGEGELWGSIFRRNYSSVTSEDVLLMSCKNSVSRRGDGRGANVLSFGSAGSTVTYLSNPQIFQSYTSIIVRCGTIVAPGGRLDWINTLCSYFILPSDCESSNCDGKQAEPSLNFKTYKASFFLDLVDVALSYEPRMRQLNVKGEIAFVECRDTCEPNEALTQKCVGFLLAAASFRLSSFTISHSAHRDYNFQIQDLGLLIFETSGLAKDCGSYDVSHLQRIGYVRVAWGSLIEVILRIKGLHWEVECSDSNINLDTCHDTTRGLFRLIDQLQELYAPDVQNALAQLQSRWNTVQQNNNAVGFNVALDNSDHSCISLCAEKKSPRNGGDSSVGLLDDIIENAFHANQISDKFLNPSLVGRDYSDNGINSDSSVSQTDYISINLPSEESAVSLHMGNACLGSKSGLGNTEKMSEKKENLPKIIEGYYLSKVILPAIATEGSPLAKEGERCNFDAPTRADVECGRGGWYKDGYLMMVENHVSNSVVPDVDQHRQENKFVPVDTSPSNNCSEKGRIILKNIDVRWRMYTGFDWSKQLESSFCKSNSTERDGSISLELIVSGLNVQHAMYPDGEVNVSKLSVDAQEFNLYDRSTNAPWRMVIGRYNTKDHPRESYSKAFKLELETVRPDPLTPLEDYRLCLEVHPIRLHLDQSQIKFLISFFGNGPSVEDSLGSCNDIDRSVSEKRSKTYGSQAIVEEALLPFFQKCDVKPLILRVDYIPHHIDLTSLRAGNYVELLNLVTWKGIDLQLKHVSTVGVYGWGSVCETVLGQWLEDISHNQVHKLLKGLAPVRSLVSVATGTSKLVTLPIKSYKRDKKLLKGIQRGAIAFVKSISLEAVGLGVHLAAGAHEMLLQTECIIANGRPNSSSPSDKRTNKSTNKKFVKINQPEDAEEGIRQAYERLNDGFSRSASVIFRAPIKEYRRGASARSAFATAIRAAPAAAIAPVTASAHAMRCALLGIRNSLDPEHKRESMDKYLGPSRS
ncbi:hypothetical protein AXF42_Ash001558 [Apostasia shenzhenica]|uniref:Autophagy-related protein 2 n=1 Tax=Apostasia shenzhenica TaxID=1088818 RepID=A0A2I0AAK3_9ASPA|nr:hypothetical protein AXF42_Ash001558 [Apostasia shenzhenica]